MTLGSSCATVVLGVHSVWSLNCCTKLLWCWLELLLISCRSNAWNHDGSWRSFLRSLIRIRYASLVLDLDVNWMRASLVELHEVKSGVTCLGEWVNSDVSVLHRALAIDYARTATWSRIVIMGESATKLASSAVTILRSLTRLFSLGRLVLLLLGIKNLDVFVVVISGWFLSLHTYLVLATIHVLALLNLLLTAMDCACWTQSRWSVHQIHLILHLLNIHRIDIHIWVCWHGTMILYVAGSEVKLLLGLTIISTVIVQAWVSSTLLLHHIPILVLLGMT